MDIFLETLMEKHAGWLNNAASWAKNTFMNLKPVQQYNKINKSLTHRTKKIVGRTLLTAGGLGYGLHHLTKAPETPEAQETQPTQTF